MKFPRLLAPESLVFLAFWLLLLLLFRERAFYDPGSLWHTVVGERILTGGLMTADPFTYTFAGHTWIPQQWAAEVLMALAHRVGSLDAQLLGFATFLAALFTWAFVRLKQAGLHPALAATFTAGAMTAAAFHFYVRPHLATIALMGWVTACLVDYERGRGGLARLAGLIPLFVVWTNLHGGVLGGLFTLGLGVGGWLALYAWGKLTGGETGSPVRSWREAATLVGIVAACSLTPFDNPFGLEMLATWKRIVGSSVLPLVVNEHKPLDPARVDDAVVLGWAGFFAFAMLGLVGRVRLADVRVSWLIPAVWFVLTLKGIRQGPLFAITSVVVLADVWPRTRWHELLKKYGDSLAHGTVGGAVPRSAFALPAAVVAAALALQVGGVRVPVVGAGWARLNPAYAPTDIGAVLDAEMRDAGPGARLFHDCNLGGYLISRHPHLKIFMDDRFELYGDAWITAYVEMIWDHPERVEVYADEFACTHALLATEPEPTPLEAYLAASPRWHPVGRGVRSVLYRRVKP